MRLPSQWTARHAASPLGTVTTLAVLVALAMPSRGEAQSAILRLPDVSPQARVSQRIGLTDVTIDYHRPRVAGRTIFGGVVPYGQVWRAGANLNTTFAVTDSVRIDGRPLAKGIYGLHMIPSESTWVVIFSKNATSWGSFSYDSTEDALRVTVRPQAVAPREVLTYELDDPTPTSAVVTLRWERVAIPFRVDVDAPHLVAQSLRDQLRGRIQTEWQAWEEAANYLLENHLDAAEALRDADASIAIEDRFENEITRARALTALGRADEARTVQARALTLGTQAQVYAFARGLQRLGQQEAALAIYRADVRRDPHSAIGRQEAARLAVAAHDFDTAARELRLGIAAAPPADVRASLDELLAQVQRRVDINR